MKNKRSTSPLHITDKGYRVGGKGPRKTDEIEITKDGFRERSGPGRVNGDHVERAAMQSYYRDNKR